MKYDLVAYIGRFQPFHVGHKSVIDYALTISGRVAVLVGSADGPRTPKNPWTAVEREAMIRANYSAEENARLIFIPIEDYPYRHDRWLSMVSDRIYGAAFSVWKADGYKIGLIGVDKDHTSFYLHHFPQFEAIPFTPDKIINATDIRRLFFSVRSRVDESVPAPTAAFLQEFYDTLEYTYVCNEWKWVEAYKKSWDKSPFPPVFMTVDAVVTNAAHILLVTRRDNPGQGLLALPGGYLKAGKTLKQTMLEELDEETNIKVPMAVLRGSIKSRRTFDDPGRSLRGRAITEAFHIALDEKTLPKVKGGDDAAHAQWVHLSQVKRSNMFEDHYHIIDAMVGL
ncbi:MAG: bifunctional nicotinamide-nucleotide adenylyltransferase/Nudix hydroxylase [Betaproteobacteria bacterium]